MIAYDCEAARLNSGIDKAVRFLAQRQQDYGEIAACRYFNPQLEGTHWLDSSPFSTTFALHALAFVEHPLAATVRANAARFLLEAMEGVGLWRYWTPRAGLVIEPDLDDTCCASYVLREALPNQAVTLANQEAILANRHNDGLFKTWLRTEGQPNDIDYVVNANVLLYLGERPETAAASAALVRLITQQPETHGSHYYVSPFALYYAIARAYDSGVTSLGDCRNVILQRLEAHRHTDGSGWGDPMATALAVCTLAAFRAFEAPGVLTGIRYLLACQQQDGGFERIAFYAGPEPPTPHCVYWGSEELTTSLCLEAFGRYRQGQTS
jgi:hypothetical protein